MISAFDLDGTLLRVNSSFAFAKYLRRYGIFSSVDFAYVLYFAIKHQLNFLSLEQIHEKAFNKLFYGRNQSEMVLWAKRFVHDHFNELINPQVVNKLKEARSAGFYTAILSSSPDFLVDPIAERLEVSCTLSSHYAVDKEGRFCTIDAIVMGKSKAEWLRDTCTKIGCPLAGVTAYSDSHYDIDFLSAAGNPIGVNPNKKLRSHCQKNGWTMM